jgi:hypothetical protein
VVIVPAFQILTVAPGGLLSFSCLKENAQPENDVPKSIAPINSWPPVACVVIAWYYKMIC